MRKNNGATSANVTSAITQANDALKAHTVYNVHVCVHGLHGRRGDGRMALCAIMRHYALGLFITAIGQI